MNASKGCVSCSVAALKKIGGMILSSIVGWVSGKVVALSAPLVVTILGVETVRDAPWLVSIVMAAVPFGISFLISTIGGVIFNRRKAVALQAVIFLLVLPFTASLAASGTRPGELSSIPAPSACLTALDFLPGTGPKLFRPVSQAPTPGPEEICDCETQWLMQAKTAHYEKNCTNQRAAEQADPRGYGTCLQAYVDMAEPLYYDPSLQSCVGSFTFWYDWDQEPYETLKTTVKYQNAVDAAALHCGGSVNGPVQTEEFLPAPVTEFPAEVTVTAAPPNRPTSEPGPSNNSTELQDLINLITGPVNSPAVPAAGAVAGTVLSWLIGLLGGGTPPPGNKPVPGRPKPGSVGPDGRVFSPVPGGGWVSKQMYDYQKGLLSKGWRWDPKTGKFAIQDGAVNEKGLVYLAGDKNGEGSRWMSPQDYANHKKLMAGGMVYDQTYGYQTPEDLRRLKAGDERWRQTNRLDDQAQNAKIKADMDALRAQQEAERAREKYIEYLKEQQGVNEFRMDKNLKAAEDYSPEVMLGGAQNISREVMTFQDGEGGFSLTALAIRGVAAGLSMGKSEIFFQSLNSLYTMKDAIDRGASGTQAVAIAIAEPIVMEGAGRVLTKGAQYGKTVFTKVFPKATKSIVQTTQTIAKKMEFMNRPVSELAGNTASTDAVQAAESSLSATEKEMLDALRSGEDPTKLYSNGGREVLGSLEEKGLITPEQARQVTGQVTQQVDQAVASSADEAARKLRLQTGVQVQKVLVADSGSSGMAKSGFLTANRSVVTDADRSLLLKVDKNALSVYAHENQMTPEQAYQDLVKRYQNLMDDGVDRALKDQGFQNGAADVDYKSYGGIGSQSGPADSYPANYTAARTEMGSTNVRSYSPNGNLTGSSDTSGRAFLDEMGLEQQKHTGLLPADPAGKIDAGELKKIADQQLNSAMNHGDVKSVAKALNRDAYVAGRQKIDIDPTLSQAAKDIVKNPQDMNSILNKYGIDPNEFIQGAREQVNSINQWFQGGTL